MSIKYKIDFIISFLLKRNIKLLSKQYIDNKQKLECQCLDCKYVWFPNFNNIKSRNSKCPRCSGVERYSYENVVNFLLSKDIKLLSRNYKTCMEKLKLKCLKCNNKWFAIFNELKNGNTGCPKCAQFKRVKSQSNSILQHHWKTNEELVCQASYEKKVVEYLNRNKIDFDWQITFDMPPKNGKRRTYRIDLYLKEQDKYVEIKGYFRKDAKEKWEWFHEEYPSSELWDKKKLKELKILS